MRNYVKQGTLNGSPSKCDNNFINLVDSTPIHLKERANDLVNNQNADSCKRFSSNDFTVSLNQSSGITNNSQNLAAIRNSTSYSSYKLIKNSQSNLMPTTNKAIIYHPLLLEPTELNNFQNTKQPSLLQTMNDPRYTESQLQDQINNLKLEDVSGSQQCEEFRKELSEKLQMDDSQNSFDFK